MSEVPPSEGPEGRELAPSGHPPTLLEAVDATWSIDGAALLHEGNYRLTGRGACIGGDYEVFLRWLLSGAAVTSGTSTILDQQPQAALREGVVGLAPPSLDVGEAWTLERALFESAALAKASNAAVSAALERTRLIRHRKVRLRDLSPLQHHLAGIAHALLTNPSCLVFDRPYAGLTDHDAQVVEVLIDDLLANREQSWVALLGHGGTFERRLRERADGGTLVFRAGRVFVAGATPRALFVRVTEARAVAEKLVEAGFRVSHVEHDRSLLVEGADGAAVFAAATSSGALVRELAPVT